MPWYVISQAKLHPISRGHDLPEGENSGQTPTNLLPRTWKSDAARNGCWSLVKQLSSLRLSQLCIFTGNPSNGFWNQSEGYMSSASFLHPGSDTPRKTCIFAKPETSCIPIMVGTMAASATEPYAFRTVESGRSGDAATRALCTSPNWWLALGDVSKNLRTRQLKTRYYIIKLSWPIKIFHPPKARSAIWPASVPVLTRYDPELSTTISPGLPLESLFTNSQLRLCIAMMRCDPIGRRGLGPQVPRRHFASATSESRVEHEGHDQLLLLLLACGPATPLWSFHVAGN
ncbi:hypothetical protein EJ02DRAFT_452166 [Clathrospora elynae]|uniref:Uncharacterized protein n=1 Tax=Clathrospora elynae TaxID=706981 RepID=A0A6A5SXZ2_9PLEO|nr:hypothetical protein EJ02DRAFT_452166 [Clathrospora elynae]